MKKCRIVERNYADGIKKYVIQQKHFLFSWQQVDAQVNSSNGAACNDSFPSLEEAKKNLCYFDGSKYDDIVVETNFK